MLRPSGGSHIRILRTFLEEEENARRITHQLTPIFRTPLAPRLERALARGKNDLMTFLTRMLASTDEPCECE